MPARVHILVSVLVLGCLLSVPAAAQPRYIPHIPERVSVGVTLGRATNADPNSGLSGDDWGLTFEAPLQMPKRFRVDVGQARWRFNGDGGNDTVTLTRATTSVITAVHPPLPNVRLGMYAGFGTGLYHYQFRSGRESGRLRLGVHALMGYEYILPGERTAIVGELKIGAAGSPGGNGTIAAPVIPVVSWALGARLRF